MYKSVNVSQSTYDQLHKIATQLHKPKAQIVAVLVEEYNKSRQKQEKKQLEEFNKEMRELRISLRLSKKIDFDPTTMDEDFAVLADTDYMR